MKEGWKYSTIGDLCDKMNGLWKGKIGPFVNVGVIRNTNFTKSFTLSFDNIEFLDVEAKQYKTRKLTKGDLIVEKSGGSDKQPVGRTVLFDKEEGEYSFSNFTSALRIKDKNVITPEFLYKYILFVYLRGDTRKMQKATTGIHNLEFDKFLSIPVPKIPLSEQQSIVDYLDSAFAKIDAMKANAEKALDEAKALFQASLKEMLEPKEGWEEKKLKEVGRTQTGTTPSKLVTTYYGGDIPFIRPAELDVDGKGGINYNSELKLTTEGALKSRIIRANSTLMCCIGSVGKTGYATQDVTCNQQINTITPYEGYNERFVYYALMAPSFQNEVIQIANSAKATLAIISKGKWEEMSIYIPLLSEQQSIAYVLDSFSLKILEMKANFDKISQECDTLKQAILRQVFE